MSAPAAAPLYTVHWPVACTRTFPPVSPSVECDHCLAAAGQPRCQLTHLSPAGARCTNVTWLLHSWACSSHAAALAPRFRNSSVEWKTMTSANYNECTRVWTKYTQYPFSTFNSTIGNGKYEYEHSLPQQQSWWNVHVSVQICINYIFNF